ncbi:MAG: Rieske 2Fe-2S domain-containing protein [Anaerolineales bacterium]|nr:Rieske 2Fe-2S domain-containing protein [Anaerolineales bacterium]
MGEKKASSPSRIDRRQFLGLTWAASLAALFGQAALALLKFFQPRIKTGGFGGRVVAGQVAEFPPGSVRHIGIGQFYISHVEDEGLLALWHRCTHLGCTVPWREEEGQFNCPCHSSFFNRAGEVTGGPAPRPLDLFPIEIVDGEVIVETGRPIERQHFDPSQATKV